MKNPPFPTFWLFLLLLIIPVLACSNLLPEPAANIPAPPTLTIPTAAATGPAFDLAPTATAPGSTGTLTATLPAGATGPTVTALVNVNVRSGPGVAYARDGFLLAGESAAITGRDPVTGWWQIVCPTNAEGTSCWVTGGDAYISATNSADVPIAVAPPLPTPLPTATPAGSEAGSEETGNIETDSGIVSILPTPSPTTTAAIDVPQPGTPFLSYVNNEDLFVLYLQAEEDRLTRKYDRQLTMSGGVNAAWISPNGRQVAYLREEIPSNALYVFDLLTSENERLVGGGDLPPLPGLGETQQTRWVDQVQWAASGAQLLFNTRIDPQEPGTGPAYDLWAIRLGESPRTIFPANTAGAQFALSAQDEVLMANATSIMRTDISGSDPETVVSFDLVNTASEFLYFPQPQWTASGDQATVAIPGPEPFARNAEATVWRIPAGSGEGIELGRLAINPLEQPLSWNSDGQRLAYVHSPAGLLGGNQLILADAAGENAETYERGRNLRFLAWGLDPSTFLFSGNGYFSVGQVGAAPVTSLLPTGQAVVAGRWLDESHFVVTVRIDEQWQLVSGNLAGDATPLVLIDNESPIIDHWTP